MKPIICSNSFIISWYSYILEQPKTFPILVYGQALFGQVFVLYLLAKRVLPFFPSFYVSKHFITSWYAPLSSYSKHDKRTWFCKMHIRISNKIIFDKFSTPKDRLWRLKFRRWRSTRWLLLAFSFPLNGRLFFSTPFILLFFAILLFRTANHSENQLLYFPPKTTSYLTKIFPPIPRHSFAKISFVQTSELLLSSLFFLAIKVDGLSPITGLQFLRFFLPKSG